MVDFLLLGKLMWVNIPFVLDPTVMRPRSLLDMWKKSYLHPTNWGDWFGLLSSKNKKIQVGKLPHYCMGLFPLKQNSWILSKMKYCLFFLGDPYISWCMKYSPY